MSCINDIKQDYVIYMSIVPFNIKSCIWEMHLHLYLELVRDLTKK